MQVHFIKSEEHDEVPIGSLAGPIIKEIFPECSPFVLPSLLTGEEDIEFFEKEGLLILAHPWRPTSGTEKALAILKLKMKWEQFAKSINSKNRVVLVIMGEKIPVGLAKLFALDEDIQVYEFIFIEEVEQVFVRELTKKSSHTALKHTSSLASFFYKMGKLSEEELTNFLEMESELSALGL